MDFGEMYTREGDGCKSGSGVAAAVVCEHVLIIRCANTICEQGLSESDLCRLHINPKLFPAAWEGREQGQGVLGSSAQVHSQGNGRGPASSYSSAHLLERVPGGIDWLQLFLLMVFLEIKAQYITPSYVTAWLGQSQILLKYCSL